MEHRKSASAQVAPVSTIISAAIFSRLEKRNVSKSDVQSQLLEITGVSVRYGKSYSGSDKVRGQSLGPVSVTQGSVNLSTSSQ